MFARSLVALALVAAPATGLARPSLVYHAPRTADGQPDLQGVWTTATLTPTVRDPAYGDRNVLTDSEAERLERLSREQVARADAPTPVDAKVTDLKNADCSGPDIFAGMNCGYNQAWKDSDLKVMEIRDERRASILTSPANGQYPPGVPGAPPPRSLNPIHTDNPEDFSVGERCILSFGSSSGPPMLPVLYNNTYQIVQSKDGVAIEVEMNHDVRLVRLNAMHGPASIRLWMGDSVGHWEGDTLVVETLNMRAEQGSRGSSPRRRVVERFTRTAPNQIEYQFTVDDPEVYATPYSGEVAMRTSKGQIYEYACHEGNYALTGMLAGARAEDPKTGAGKPP